MFTLTKDMDDLVLSLLPHSRGKGGAATIPTRARARSQIAGKCAPKESVVPRIVVGHLVTQD